MNRLKLWPPKTGFRIIFAITLAVRLMALAYVWKTPFTSDANDYVAMGRQMLSGEHFLPYWPPGLPIYLLPYLKVGVCDGVLRLAMLPFWGVAVWGFWRLAKALQVESTAWILLLVFGLSPAAIHLSIEPLTQLPIAAFLLVALGAALRCAQSSRTKDYLLLGLSLGASSLIRPSAIPILFMLPAFITFKNRRKLNQCMLSLIMGVGLIGGWLFRSHQLSGQWVINIANTQNFWDGNNPWTPDYRTWYFGSHAKLGSDEITQFPAYKQILTKASKLPSSQYSSYFQHLSTEYIAQHPGRFVYRTLNRMRCFWGFDSFTSLTMRAQHNPLFYVSLPLEAIFFLVLVGKAVLEITRAEISWFRKWEVQTVAATIVLYSLPYWISMSHPTYHFPILAPLSLLGSSAQHNQTTKKRFFAPYFALVALFLIQVEWVAQMYLQLIHE